PARRARSLPQDRGHVIAEADGGRLAVIPRASIRAPTRLPGLAGRFGLARLLGSLLALRPCGFLVSLGSPIAATLTGTLLRWPRLRDRIQPCVLAPLRSGLAPVAARTLVHRRIGCGQSGLRLVMAIGGTGGV